MEVNIEHRGKHALVAPAGEVDLNVSTEFQQSLREAIKDAPERLIVDLTAVPYMDSSGVATLVDAMQQTRRINASLVLCGMQPKVRSIFEITRLDAVFTIVKSLDDAIAV